MSPPLNLVFLSNANAVHLKEWSEYFQGRLGHRCTVLTIPRQQLSYDGVEVIDIGNKFSGSKLGWPLLVPRIRRILREKQADLFIAYRVVSYGFLASLVRFRPLVMAAQGGDLVWPPDDRFGQFTARRACRAGDYFNAWSANIRDELIKYGADPAKIFTCSRGIDFKTFPTLPQKSAGPPLLCVTRGLLPSYNFVQLIQAMPIALRELPDLKLVIAGDGSERPRLEAEAHALGVSGSIEFLGHQKRPAIVSLLERAHLYVSTTITDGLPLSHFEAMAAGVIPIVSDIAANRIWIRDGENGFLFPIGDPGALAAKIVRAWRERDWRARVVEQNRALVLREHDRDVNMKKMEQGWVELVRNSHP